jgi:hypothetical protein
MIAAGYAGYAEWPWWWATILGALAGAWNAGNRFFISPWRDRENATGALAFVLMWTGTLSALFFTVIYFVVRWISSILA